MKFKNLLEESVIKKLIITALSILTVFGLSACGNVEKNDKEVTTTTSSVSGVVTTKPSTYTEYEIDWTVTTTEGQTFGVTTSETTIYEEESTESKAVTTLPEGTQIIIDSKATDSEFIPVTTTTGERGYISTSTYKDIDEGYTTDHGSSEVNNKGTTTSPASTSAPTTTTVAAKPVTTTTVTTKAPTVVSSEKKTTTTTTKKKVTTTTTTKKNTTTTTTKAVKGKKMWVGWETIGYNVGEKLNWWTMDNSINFKESDEVTAYETVTVNTKNGGNRTLTRVKMSNGKYTYIENVYLVSEKPYIVEITEADVKKLCQELQEYSNSIFTKQRGYSPKSGEWLVEDGDDGYRWGTYDEYIADRTPSNSSWHNVTDWYVEQHSQNGIDTYEIMLKYMKRQLDFEYQEFPNSHQVVYYEKSVNSHTGKAKWDIYLLY